MPRVQAYESSGTLAPLRAPRVQSTGEWQDVAALAEGAQRLGQGLSRVGAQAADIVARERDRATDIATLDATNGLQSFLTSTLEEAGDEQGRGAGFLRTRGRAAFEREAPTLEAIEKKRQELAEALPTEEARRRYDARSRAMVDAARGRMESHLAQERDTAAELTLRTTVEAAKGALAYGYADPGTRAEQLEQVRTAVRTRYAHAPPEQLATLMGAAEADLHADVVERFITAGDTEGALSYFDTHKAALGKQAGPLEGRLSREREALHAERKAADIIEAARDPDVGWADPAKALAAIDSVPEKQREAVRKLVEHQAGKAEALRKQQGSALLNELIAIHERTGTTSHPRVREIRDAMLEPKNGWAELWRNFELDVEREQRAREAHLRARTASDREADRAQREANRLARAEFAAMPPEEMAGLKVHEHPAFVGADRATRLELEGQRRKRADALTGSQGMKESGFYKALQEDVDTDETLRRNEKKAKEYKAFMGEWRRDFVEREKREPRPEEVEKARAEARLKETKTTLGIFKSSTYRFERGEPLPAGSAPARTPTSSVNLDAPAAVPDDARRRILERAAAKYPGRTLSEEQIRAVYAAEQQGAR